MRAFMTGEVVPVRVVESIKWVALGLMLLDHVDHYLFGRQFPVVYLLGRLVLPLFTVALAVGLAHADRGAGLRVLQRLVTWGFIAQLGVWLLRDEVVPLNVLVTIALGVWVALAFERGVSWWRRVGVLAASLLVGVLAEFGPFGVAWVAIAVTALRVQSVERWVVVALASVMLAVPNGTVFGTWGVLLAVVLGRVCVEVPRVRHVFYAVYALQFPVLWMLREVML